MIVVALGCDSSILSFLEFLHQFAGGCGRTAHGLSGLLKLGSQLLKDAKSLGEHLLGLPYLFCLFYSVSPGIKHRLEQFS